MNRAPLSRRTVLRGSGSVAVALPFLEAMLPRMATAAPAPKRFVYFFFPNGVNPSSWFPAGASSGLGTLPETLSPLAPLQSKLVVLAGVNMQSARENPGNAHGVGMTNLLTGRKFIFEENTRFGAEGWGAGITIDQEIASRIGVGSRYASLQFGVQTLRVYGGAPVYAYTSYSGPSKPMPCEDNPQRMFTKLFTTIDSGSGDAQARLDRRKSVLDFIGEDFRQVNTRVGAGDRSKLDAHLTALRDIESRLSFVGKAGPACTKPIQTYPRDHNTNSAFPAVGKLQMDMLAMAFACELTQVATLQWSSGASGTTHTWAGANEPHHSLSHKTDAASVAQLQRIQQWYMTQLAYLGQALAIKDSNGVSVLDNSVVLAGSEVGVGPTHTYLNMPYVLLGGAGGAIKTNRFIKYSNATHNDLFVSIMNATGIPATSFGDPKYSMGPLPGLAG